MEDDGTYLLVQGKFFNLDHDVPLETQLEYIETILEAGASCRLIVKGKLFKLDPGVPLEEQIESIWHELEEEDRLAEKRRDEEMREQQREVDEMKPPE